MNNAALYKHSNELQRRDAREVLEEFSDIFNWRLDGEDSLLDIGCGSADVTIDYILPILSENFKRLVGVDLSVEMIQYAQKKYIHPKISFERFDLGMDIQKQSIRHVQPFDHITSFYCLNWVHNQKQAIQNIYNLLKPNGDCLLMFAAYHPLFEAYEKMSQSSKWEKYMKDANRFMSPYQHSIKPDTEFERLLRAFNFSEYHVEHREKVFFFDDYNDFKNFLKAVNPFYERIPPSEQHAYFDDLINLIKLLVDSRSNYSHSNECSTKIRISYQVIIAHARK